ncbi:hypothetical protein BP354E_3477 [Burkholderia pseudomallei 354e]|uniref:Uncharacterized protein n=1 Tax=Burkholderia pseudomallei (strain 1026b) TaxID=884204 RepID=A0A0H3HTP9_BURP2|nr:hypothetical protein BP1026B_II1024 [Burkholderia pseudomallei 1026b]EIF60592.1 hypothetical protein BP1026A_2704 [Burkholderia pseudomallei 1026a]EIF73559.1 hypothetical protein BP354E_3477 [Burkholderia pseudomallei 354e]EIF78041.1 hypothetical protein BP354A_4289 [Burkholderia pseudomallei 354a]
MAAVAASNFEIARLPLALKSRCPRDVAARAADAPPPRRAAHADMFRLSSRCRPISAPPTTCRNCRVRRVRRPCTPRALRAAAICHPPPTARRSPCGYRHAATLRPIDIHASYARTPPHTRHARRARSIAARLPAALPRRVGGALRTRARGTRAASEALPERRSAPTLVAPQAAPPQSAGVCVQ